MTDDLWTDANKLRLLALWFDKWDATDYADRQALLDEGPGKNDVQRDLRAIADRLDRAALTPPAAIARDALLDIERWSKGFGPTMYNNDEDAGRGTMGRIHRRAREALDATPDRADPLDLVTTPEGTDR